MAGSDGRDRCSDQREHALDEGTGGDYEDESRVGITRRAPLAVHEGTDDSPVDELGIGQINEDARAAGVHDPVNLISYPRACA